MPYKRHAPATEEEMEKRMKGGNTICNIIRGMYHMTDDPDVRMKCRLAFSMGKAMSDRLAKYYVMYGNGDGTELKELREREPAPLWEMDKKRWEGHHSICQTIRDTYHMTDNEDLKMKCRVAMAMTKAMHEKLKWYKAKEMEQVEKTI